nr:hypothetical protein [Enterovibrio norvegicus]
MYMLIADDIPSLEIDENPFEIEQLHIMPVNPSSPYKNKRLTAHPSRLENGEPQFTALEDEEGLQSLLTELPIMPDLKDKIIYELNEIGINEHSIYNSLYGLCRHINLMYDNNQCSRITPEDADLPTDASADGDLKKKEWRRKGKDSHQPQYQPVECWKSRNEKGRPHGAPFWY